MAPALAPAIVVVNWRMLAEYHSALLAYCFASFICRAGHSIRERWHDLGIDL